MSIKTRLTDIQNSLPENISLVAVSKTQPVDVIMEAYNAGQRVFGENKVQEMVSKWEQMPKDIEWHMIGHLQRNKVKYMAEFVSLVHGVDSIRLLKEINKQAQKHNRTIDCLLQIHIASEESKFGMSETELFDLLKSEEFLELKNIRIKGLMGMATFTDDSEQIESEFRFLSNLYSKIKDLFVYDNPDFNILSIGMSGDYKIAIDNGSTMVRIGSSIFGARNYN